MIANGFEAFFWTILGLAFGSFANVVIHRLPRHRSLLRPGSVCPRCRKPIRWFDNVPLLAYAWLRGRCRHCRKTISSRYPIVEAVVGLLGWGLWQRHGSSEAWTLLALAACTVLVIVAMIDWDTFLIPDELSLGLLVLGLCAAPLNPSYSGGALERWAQAALGAAAGFSLCFAVAAFGKLAFKKEAMGGGDVKLLAAVGAWSGALGAFDCLVVGSFFGAAYGIALLMRKKVQRSDPIPFGPFLAIGAVLNFFFILPFGFPFST